MVFTIANTMNLHPQSLPKNGREKYKAFNSLASKALMLLMAIIYKFNFLNNMKNTRKIQSFAHYSPHAINGHLMEMKACQVYSNFNGIIFLR